MFHNETLARVIQADRVRDLERAAEVHRLLAAERDVVSAPAVAASDAVRPVVVAACTDDGGHAHVGGSTNLAA